MKGEMTQFPEHEASCSGNWNYLYCIVGYGLRVVTTVDNGNDYSVCYMYLYSTSSLLEMIFLVPI